MALLRRTVTGSPSRDPDVPLCSYLGLGPYGIGIVRKPLRCYVCHTPYVIVDRFYHALCPACADKNRAMRGASASLAGMHAVVTGGRVKIGHALALMLLRDGARVTVTTRFPRDAVRRFARASACEEWWDRLTVVGADFRSPAEVLDVIEVVASLGTVDILVNNAAQTIQRPVDAYRPLARAEQHEAPFELEASIARYSRLSAAALEAGAAVGELPPAAADATGRVPGQYDEGLLPVPIVDASGLIRDMTSQNSWSKRLGEVGPIELLEVQLCNVVAPFLLVSELMAGHRGRRPRYVVNVSATEGQFSRRYKGAAHPHTNMAKAALNMLTRTSAGALAEGGVFMTSVDTGWVTDERPFPLQQEMARRGFQPPLDVVDGAARLYHPIVAGQRGEMLSKCLLKHYRKVRW